ncbi:unnamed protein product [Adineta steineri]|uniref:G-protein coupled receptors family 1 profile domain-containing protein n=1 Tax=Adineta steineri TaxID=433720 RepID=A0A815B1M6_9BILA|nr:unnamed protein product [Adineta steineri]CAF1552385.1 unnamed protein product [Adineta steineri]
MTTNTTSSNAFVVYLANIQKQITRTLVVPLVVGFIGNFISCVVFRQKQLRSNAMSLLLTAASIFNIIVLIYGIGTSLYGVDHTSPDTYSIVFCKIRIYIRHILLMTVRSYITLASAASFALTSSRTNLRSLCDMRYVKWAIVVVPFIWTLIAIHMPFFTIIRNNQCVNANSYIIPYAIYFFLVVGIFPVISMVLFILLTVKNLRSLRRRIQPSVVNRVTLKSRDQQFIRMLSALVIMYVTTNLFYPSNVLYSAITNWSYKSSDRIAIESLVYSITSNYVLYINNVSPFFLFFSSSTTFRQSFYRIIIKYMQHILGKSGRTQQMPMTTIPTGQNKF